MLYNHIYLIHHHYLMLSTYCLYLAELLYHLLQTYQLHLSRRILNYPRIILVELSLQTTRLHLDNLQL
nr:MAG TPA: hypothetical protein [Caudoviricetes sp.]